MLDQPEYKQILIVERKIKAGLFTFGWIIILRTEQNGRNFQIHFREWKFMYFGWNLTEICSLGPINNMSLLGQVMF